MKCRTADISEILVHMFSRVCRIFIFQIESEFMRLYMNESRYS